MTLDYYAYPEWDEDEGWALTLPPPNPRDAHVSPHIVNGNTLRWSCHWWDGGYGGSGYFFDLPKALQSLGEYLTKRAERHALRRSITVGESIARGIPPCD